MAAESEWHGTSTNGIEIRRADGEIDEIIVWRNGSAFLHIEQLENSLFWMRIAIDEFEMHATCFAKNRRAHVAMNAEVNAQ